MRKFFSLIAAVLFAGSMMAAVTITPANCGWTSTAAAQEGTAVEGVTISVTNGLASEGQSPDQIRVYKDATLTISATSNIISIEFTCTATGTTKYGPGCFNAQEGYSFETNGYTGTWKGSATSVTFTAGSAQVRATQIVVTLEGEGGGDTPGGDTPGGDTPGGDTPGGDTPSAEGIVITPANCGWTSTAAAQEGTAVEGVTISVTNGLASEGQSPDQIRIYKDATLTISAESNITKIEFTCTATGTTKYGPGCFETQEGYTFEADGYTGTWVGSAKSVTFTASSAQVRATQIVVTLEGGSVEPLTPTELLQSYLSDLTLIKEFLADYVEDFSEAAEIVKQVDQWVAAGNLALESGNEAAIQAAISQVEESYKGFIDNFIEQAQAVIDAELDNLLVLIPEEYQEACLVIVNNLKEVVAGIEWNFNKSVAENLADLQAMALEYVQKANTDIDHIINPSAGPTTCAEAAEAALSVSANNELYNGGATYTIPGYVTSIAYEWKDGSMSFWMADTENGGNVLEAYKCAIADKADAVRVGDKVEVTGSLTKYNKTPEFAAGCTVVILERAEVVDPVNLGEKTIAEFLELKNTNDTCVLTGIVANIVMDKDDPTKYNAYGNFDLVDETGSVYVYGLLTADGQTKKFIEMGIDEGDTLTIKAVYYEYNGTPQAKNAVFVEVRKAEGGTQEDETYPWDEETDFMLTFASYTIDDSDLAEWGSLYVEAQDDEMNYIILDITLPSEATELTPGVYTIDDTYDFLTVHAGLYDEEYGIIPSYAAVLVEEEGELMINNIWWIVSGTVSIDDKLNIVVEATNSLGKIIKVYLAANDDPTAISNTAIDTKAVKTIENGQFFIEKAGVRYNAQGAVVR